MRTPPADARADQSNAPTAHAEYAHTPPCPRPSPRESARSPTHESRRGRAHIQLTRIPGQIEAIHDQRRINQRQQLIRPLVHVHVRVQTRRLLQDALRLTGRLQLIHRCSLRHEETERIKMRAADAVALHHAVRALRTQAQLQVVVADVVLHGLVCHRPLVHAEATELPLLRGRIAQDLVGEGEGGGAALHKIGDVYGDGGGRLRLGARLLGEQPAASSSCSVAGR